MGADIIAESQTESVLAALDRGDADDKVRDQVSAALLRAMSKLGTELEDIKANLWKPDDLRHLIDERHERKCRDCPAKKMAEERLHLQQAQQAAMEEARRRQDMQRSDDAEHQRRADAELQAARDADAKAREDAWRTVQAQLGRDNSQRQEKIQRLPQVTV